MECADYWLFRSYEWENVLRYPKSNHISTSIIKSQNKIVSSTFVFPVTRKRRRQDDSMRLPERSSKAIVGPNAICIQYPISYSQSSQSIVNALAGILPLDIKVNLFGYAHSMILVAVMYKHNNLCWILLNRMNLKFYIASHFVADALHLFAKHRDRLQFSSDRKWHRQGINEIMTLAVNPQERSKKHITKMNSLPKGILRFNHTKQSFHELSEFLRGVGPSGQFLNKFTRQQSPPPGFRVPSEQLCEYASGWKIFKKTQFNQLCKLGCPCETIVIHQGPSLQHSVINLIANVPSSLDKKAKNVFETHFETFLQFIQKNPNLSFYPTQDI